MAKGLRSYPKEQRKAVAARRIASKSKGLSYWGALDYMKRIDEKKDAEKDGGK